MKKEETAEKGDKRDMATLMRGIMERVRPPWLDCAMDADLPDAFLKIVPSCDLIPLFDASNMALIAFPPTVLDKAGTLEAILDIHGMNDPQIVDNVRKALRLEMATNRELNRTPKYYPLALAKGGEIPVAKTEMDDAVGGYIYTTATQMPSQEKMKLQHAYYGFLIAYLFEQLELSQHSEVRYAYRITGGNRLNLFMSIVR